MPFNWTDDPVEFVVSFVCMCEFFCFVFNSWSLCFVVVVDELLQSEMRP